MQGVLICIMTLVLTLPFAACANDHVPLQGGNGGDKLSGGMIPQELAEIPSEYDSAADEQGALVELYYDTYESFSYEAQTRPLRKRAIMYLHTAIRKRKAITSYI